MKLAAGYGAIQPMSSFAPICRVKNKLLMLQDFYYLNQFNVDQYVNIVNIII
jgi:hypothetical protein